MKPYEKYPTSIEYGGVKYELDLSFKAVLLVLDVYDDEQLSEESKCKIALNILVKDEHPQDVYLLEKIFELISPEKKSSGEKVIDIEKDFDYIIASFRQAYGIDIVRDNLHYLEFIALLNGMPEGTKIYEVVKIRQMPIPEINEYNKEYVIELLKAKNNYSLEDVKANSFNDGLALMFNRLKGGM